MTEGFDPILIFTAIRVIVSLLAALFALAIYRFYRGGVMATAWPFFIIAAILQATAGFGEIIDGVFRNEFAGEIIERLSDILSVLAFLWFTIRLKNSWEQLKP